MPSLPDASYGPVNAIMFFMTKTMSVNIVDCMENCPIRTIFQQK